MVYARDLKSLVRKGMRVRVPLAAQLKPSKWRVFCLAVNNGILGRPANDVIVSVVGGFGNRDSRGFASG